MGKRSKSDTEDAVEEEVDVKKVKKSKKDKKEKEETVCEVRSPIEAAEETEVITEAVEAGKISTADFDRVRPQFKKWLKEYKDKNLDEMTDDDISERFEKYVKKFNKGKLPEEYLTLPTLPPPVKVYPPIPTTGDVSILLFYAYVPKGLMTRAEQDAAIAFCYKTLSSLGMTGRLRIAREGYNSTLTGNYKTVRQFTDALREFSFETFGHTDFKYVDGLPDNQMLKGLKVWPVTEIVTYGFNYSEAPLHTRGVHLSPQDFHNAMMDPNTVVIDVRNFNETVLGKFAPANVLESNGESGGAKVLDPCMRRSTEFPQWVKDHHDELKDKKVLMYCTAGVRCERASSFLKHQGIDDVYQLDGGIHRYLEAFPESGGFWVGKNYTFDKRFNHGAKESETIAQCVYCEKPWDRYQAQKKCGLCAMEVILCKDCQKIKPNIPRHKLICPLCKK